MKKTTELSIKSIYKLYAVVFFFVVMGYTGALWYFTAFDSVVIWISLGLAVTLLILGGALLWTMRVKMRGMIGKVDDIVERAINRQERMTGYEETSISALENKVHRYVDMSMTHEKNIEAEKSKIKALISDISHQTKTPLSNIILYSQLLGEVAGLDEESSQYVDRIKLQSEKLDWLIESLVKMSRMEAGIISIQTASLPVVGAITQAISQIYSAAERKGIEVRISCDANVKARHDAKWTSEALFNMLENAVKYSESGGRINITTHSSEMFTRIDITDTGMGIEENELNLIFRRFFRSKRVTEYEGVGIGLFLAREIVTAQGGYIKVTSKVGEGSVFSVFLPVL